MKKTSILCLFGLLYPGERSIVASPADGRD
jgi:hypothetical protein